MFSNLMGFAVRVSYLSAIQDRSKNRDSERIKNDHGVSGKNVLVQFDVLGGHPSAFSRFQDQAEREYQIERTTEQDQPPELVLYHVIGIVHPFRDIQKTQISVIGAQIGIDFHF